MKALATLAACLALAVATPSRAVVIMAAPHHPPPQPHAQPTRPLPPLSHHRHDETGIGDGQEVFDDTPAPENAADVPFILPPPAERCPAVEPVVVRSSGPHIIYIGQKPPTPANLPKVIYGTD